MRVPDNYEEQMTQKAQEMTRVINMAMGREPADLVPLLNQKYGGRPSSSSTDARVSPAEITSAA